MISRSIGGKTCQKWEVIPEQLSLEEALKVLNPDYRDSIAIKRGAYKRVLMELEKGKKKMKKISFKNLDKLSEILSNFSEEEREELIHSFNSNMEIYYTDLQYKGWEITTNKGNPIFNLHKNKTE